MKQVTSARKHIVANAVLQFALAAVYACVLVTLVVAAVLFFYGDSGWGPFADQADNPTQRAGNLFGIAALIVTCLTAGIWTVVNAVGLVGTKPWARVTTSAYWFFSLLTVIGIPLSLYGLWSLGRDNVREAFCVKGTSEDSEKETE